MDGMEILWSRCRLVFNWLLRRGIALCCRVAGSSGGLGRSRMEGVRLGLGLLRELRKVKGDRCGRCLRLR